MAYEIRCVLKSIQILSTRLTGREMDFVSVAHLLLSLFSKPGDTVDGEHIRDSAGRDKVENLCPPGALPSPTDVTWVFRRIPPSKLNCFRSLVFPPRPVSWFLFSRSEPPPTSLIQTTG